jgi:NAD(P)-dependent dehydrogenase (short-subunit alcohol dehydrogenase family)
MSTRYEVIAPGSVVLITGSTGIGAATARLAAAEGARVFVVSRTEEHCKEIVDEILSGGGECAYGVADLTAADQVQNVVDSCLERYGRIDALFNVAGISGRKFGDGPLHQCSEDGWDITFDTNVKSMFLVCRAVINQMLQQDVGAKGIRGAILNMASVLAFSPEPNYFVTHAYAASKGAIISMSKSMASYYALHSIRINVIAPALVRTPMSGRAQNDTAILELLKHKQPLAGDFISAEDVAKAALFLLGGSSSMITGEELTVDAGWCVSG